MTELRKTRIDGVDYTAGQSGVDSSTNTLQTIDYPHHEIHAGSSYRVQAFNDSIASAGTVSLSFFVPDQTLLPHLVFEYVHEGDMTITLLEATTLTLSTGTDVLCKNSRRDAGDTSILQGVSTGSLASYYVTKDATYSGGTAISIKRNYASKGDGAEGSRKNEIILKSNTYYTLVMTNNEATDQGGQIRMEWYEHADKN